MKLILFVAAVVVSCQASTFLNAPRGNGCSYPNWKCDCKVVYRCDGISGFPTDFSVPSDADSGCLKDLAPDDYQLRIPGKRWRRNIWSQEEFCKNECRDRLNAFLCFDGSGDFTDYSGAALCLKLLDVDPTFPFLQDGTVEPCCEVYLQWGLDWCPAKWHSLEINIRCLSRSAVDFATNAAGSTPHLFSVATGCAIPSTDFTWCGAGTMCAAP